MTPAGPHDEARRLKLLKMFDVLAEFIALIRGFDDHKVDYALCGGLAMVAHGFVRATEDIDLTIEPGSLPQAQEVASHCGFVVRGRDRQFRSGVRIVRVIKPSVDDEDYLLLDLILVGPATQAAWNSRVNQHTPWGTLRVVSREALVAMKRQAGRPQDLVDIERLEHPSEIH